MGGGSARSTPEEFRWAFVIASWLWCLQRTLVVDVAHLAASPGGFSVSEPRVGVRDRSTYASSVIRMPEAMRRVPGLRTPHLRAWQHMG